VRNAKTWIVAAAGALVTLIVLQNMQSWEISLLFWTFAPPKALLILFVLILGVIIGWALPGRRR
jgi:uncharacterized integral membrane protein